jgi:hypothetical protein
MGYTEYTTLLTATSGQAVTADANSTNYLDFELTDPHIEEGRIVGFLVTVMVKTTAGTGIIFEICQKTSEPTHADAVIASFRILAADLAAAAQIFLPLPQGVSILRYMRVYFDVIGGSESYTLHVSGPMPWPCK